MAELGVIASVIGIASTGIKLSSTLYTYSQTVCRADLGLRDVAQDVSLTSAILTELGNLLQEESETKFCSASAIKTADDAIKGCKNVFEEIETALQGSLKKGNFTKTLSTLGRLKWPLSEKKMEYLRSHLDRLKTTLSLLLQVLNYGRALKSRASGVDQSLQRYQINQLATKDRLSKVSPSLLDRSLDLTSAKILWPPVEPTKAAGNSNNFPDTTPTTYASVLRAAPDKNAIRAADPGRNLYQYLKNADHTEEDIQKIEITNLEPQNYESLCILMAQFSMEDIINCQNWVDSTLRYLQEAERYRKNQKDPLIPDSTQSTCYAYMCEKLDKIFKCSTALHKEKLDENRELCSVMYGFPPLRVNHEVAMPHPPQLASGAAPATSFSEQKQIGTKRKADAKFESEEFVEDSSDLIEDEDDEPLAETIGSRANTNKHPKMESSSSKPHLGHEHSEENSQPLNIQSQDENTRGLIRNVTENVDVSSLSAALASIATVVYMDINRAKNCAFVDFDTPADYRAAVAANPYEVAGERLYIEERPGHRVDSSGVYGGPGSAGRSPGRGNQFNPQQRGGFSQNQADPGANRFYRIHYLGMKRRPECYRCGTVGHIARNCSAPPTSEYGGRGGFYCGGQGYNQHQKSQYGGQHPPQQGYGGYPGPGQGQGIYGAPGYGQQPLAYPPYQGQQYAPQQGQYLPPSSSAGGYTGGYAVGRGFSSEKRGRETRGGVISYGGRGYDGRTFSQMGANQSNSEPDLVEQLLAEWTTLDVSIL